MSLYTVSINPKDIPNLKHWIDFADINTINNSSDESKNGDSIGKVIDKSQNVGWTAPTVSPIYLYSVSNGKNMMRVKHDSSLNRSLKSPNFNLSFGIKSIFLVYIPDSKNNYSTTGTQYPLSIYSELNPIGDGSNPLPSSYPEISINFSFTDYRERYWESTGTYSSLSISKEVTIKMDEIQIVGVRTSIDVNKYDFVLDSNDLSNLYGDESSNSIQKYWISLGDIVGNTYAPNNSKVPYAEPFDGWIGEFLLFDRNLSDDEYNRVMEYLKSKWVGS